MSCSNHDHTSTSTSTSTSTTPPPATPSLPIIEMRDVNGNIKHIAESSVTRFLVELEPPLQTLRTFTHETVPESFEQAAVERGQQVHQIIRSILFRLSGDKSGEFVLVLCP